mmetsp:Transcript_10053/g.28584  ORF Transcript_10053/g.28584 Transcript_10053/m.28584 type:complete len:1102 (+) Transcript_10053:561-3866(+)
MRAVATLEEGCRTADKKLQDGHRKFRKTIVNNQSNKQFTCKIIFRRSDQAMSSSSSSSELSSQHPRHASSSGVDVSEYGDNEDGDFDQENPPVTSTTSGPTRGTAVNRNAGAAAVTTTAATSATNNSRAAKNGKNEVSSDNDESTNSNLYVDDLDDSNLSLASEDSLMCCTPSPFVLGLMCCLVLVMCGALAAGIVVGLDRRNDTNERSALTAAPVTPSPTGPPSTSAPTVPLPPTMAPTRSPVDPVTQTPTNQPTPLATTPPDPRFFELANIAGPAVFQDGTPEQAAANWILFDDPALMDDSNNTTTRRYLQQTTTINIQRFLLAYFYFATSQNGPWRSCNNPSTTTSSSCRFSKLTGIHDDGTLMFTSMEGIAWLSEMNECEWMGIQCNGENSTVSEISLAAQILTGNLGATILQLPSLEVLELGYNELSGRLDPQFGRLKVLSIENNNFNGNLPMDELLSNAEAMTVLNLRKNQFGGSIVSSNWANAKALTVLDISSNSLLGDIPIDEIGKIATLKEFKANNNQFQDRLPSNMGTLAWNAALETLWLSDNSIVGRIPDTIGQLINLVDVRLNGCMFTSSLPDSIYTLAKLQILHLQDNRLLSGSISPSVGGLTELTDLRLSRNSFSEAIPTELGSLEKLTVLELNFNGFSGPVPSELCQAPVSEMRWDLLQADCQPPEAPPNACACCTQCCSRDEETCDDNRDEALYREFLAEKVGKEVNDAGSPADQALLWLVYQDPLELSVRASNLVQRYLVALFYFHTTTAGLWTSCNPPTADETDTCTIPKMVEGKIEAVETTRWLTGVSECKWEGVACGGTFGDVVVGISVADNELSNSIPDQLQLLTSLQKFAVPSNKMNGTIPEFLGSIETLSHLELRNNTFDGTIAGRFFTGNAEFVTFDVAQNKLSGNFPNAIGRESKMVTLDISDNDFEGTITSSLSRLPVLETLNMGGNSFGPTIPAILSDLVTLKTLSLRDNMLGQSIPEALYTMENLITLDLSENMLTGGLTSGITQMSSLENLVLYSNNLSDPIPTELGEMNTLKVISLAFNGFQGSIPTDVCDLPMLATLVSDCAGKDPITCDCCTGCCDPLINICFANDDRM